MMNNRVPAVTGTVAVIDPTGQVAPGIRRYLDPQAMAERRDASFNRAIESQPDGRHAAGAGGAAAQRAVLGELPQLEIAESPLSALDEQKERLTQDAADRQLAVLVVHPERRTSPNDEGIFGAYDLFVRRNLDNRIQNGDSKCGGRSDRRRARARRGTGPAADRRADQSARARRR